MKKLPFYALMSTNESLETCCGVNEVGSFDLERPGDGGAQLEAPMAVDHGHAGLLGCSGSGLFVSVFVNEEDSMRAYEELCREHVLLYQSPVKVNRGSGNKLFLCVFLHKDRKGKAKKESSAWPATHEAQQNTPLRRSGEVLPQW